MRSSTPINRMKRYNGENSMVTPPELFAQLARIFTFDYDAACTEQNCLCATGAFFDAGINGLVASWRGRRVWCNPPYSQKAAWIKKASEEVEFGGCHVCVMILPTNSMETPAWHRYIYGQYHYEILSGRVAFIEPITGKPQPRAAGNSSGTTIIYFMKKVRAK